MFSLADLAVLIEAVQQGSLSAAGRRLGLTPVAASRGLAALEAEVGARLIHRTTRSLSLTPEGEEFLPHAEAILAHAEEGRAAVADGEEEAGGLLRVAASVPFGRKILTPMLVKFLGGHHRLKVELLLSDAVADLAAQGIDVAVRFGELRDSTLVARRLANNARGLYASPAYLARHPAPRRVVELRQHNCLGIPAARQWTFEHKGRAVRQTVAGRFAADSMEALHEAAVRGLGIVQLSDWNVHDDVAAGRLMEIRLADGAVPDQGIWAVLPTRRYVPRKVHLFLDALSDHLSAPSRSTGDADRSLQAGGG